MASIKSNIEQIPSEITYIDQGDANNIYLGIAKIGGATGAAIWQIRKISTSGGTVTILFASGTAAFDKIWDNRAGYSYS